jgi:hypothetical protein
MDSKAHHIRHPVGSSFQLHPKAFLFLDRSMGTTRFEVNARPDESLPVDEATSLLAMQCVVRG